MLVYPLWNCSQSAQPSRPPPAQRVRLPAGTRVLVQRLVAKPEHNGKRARVLSFDARTGRYAVSLDDGKELFLKAECVAKAGCAAAGCASDEASNMCGRCEAVRYCSRESQRTDWKAYKPACTAAQRLAVVRIRNQELCQIDRASVGHSTPDSHSRRSTH